MQAIPYLGFDGRCAEAFRFYAGILGGEIRALMTHGESPAAGEVPASWHHLVVHAHLVAGDAQLMGGDQPSDFDGPPQGMCVNLVVDSVEESERIYAALAAGGRVTMPMETTFWAERFAMLVDRFGTPWIINSATTPAAGGS